MKGNRVPRGGNDAKKKMIIKPFKSTPKIPANFEAEAWTKLQSAIHAVHNNALVNISKEELYRVCLFLSFIVFCFIILPF
jgi:hypothetical protein